MKTTEFKVAVKKVAEVKAELSNNQDYQKILNDLRELEAQANKIREPLDIAESELRIIEDDLIKDFKARNITESDGVVAKIRESKEVNMPKLYGLTNDIDLICTIGSIKQKDLNAYLKATPLDSALKNEIKGTIEVKEKKITGLVLQ